MAKAGQTVTRVEIGRDGKLVIIVGKPEDAAGESAIDANEWESGAR
jgi:hypothetical protein